MHRTTTAESFHLTAWLPVILLATLVAAKLSAAGEWATGTRLQKRLKRPVNIVWSGVPLRRAISTLSQSQGVAVLIDRRVDPGRRVDILLSDVPLMEAMEQIAESQNQGVTMLGPVVYFCPPQVAARLRAVAESSKKALRKLPPEVRGKFFRPKRIAWDDFATPRGLLEKLAEENGLEIVALDLVPHDLWAGCDLPPISLADRFTLILVQYDLTFRVVGGKVYVQRRRGKREE